MNPAIDKDEEPNRIVKLSKSQTQNERIELISQTNPWSITSEAYRILKTNLLYKNFNGGLKYLAITSSLPQEGKSTTVANLAFTLAQGGKRVVVLDGDLRRPKIHKLFGLSANRGLADALVEELDPLSLCKPVKGLELRILPAGAMLPNPSEQLGSERMKYILQRLGSTADYVLVDCTPVLGLNDTLAMAPLMDSYLIVVGSGKVKKNELKNAKQQLEKAGASVLGIVVNRFNIQNQGNAYGYYEQTR